MKLYKIGFILILLSWLAGLNPYWTMLAAPVFIGGLLMVWFSKAKLRTKLLTVFLPLMLWYPAMRAFMLLGSKYRTPETFLIPKNFRGQITLMYDEPCGQTAPKTDGRLIYKIPANGVMILTNKFETGIVDQKCYFVDDNWKPIEEIPQIMQPDFNKDYTIEKNGKESSSDKVRAFLVCTGNGSTEKNKDYKFLIMAINCLDTLRVKPNNRIVENLIDSLLYNCRKK